MRNPTRVFVLFEGLAFIIASLIHFGLLIHEYEHFWAGRAEGVIGIALLVGYVLTSILPRWSRGIGLAVQAFALLGTSVGIYTIAIGIGPRTIPDVTFHIAILIALIFGIVVTARAQKRVIQPVTSMTTIIEPDCMCLFYLLATKLSSRCFPETSLPKAARNFNDSSNAHDSLEASGR